MSKSALILSEGFLMNNHAKTTHGLIRTSRKYNIKGVIDSDYADQDTGQLIDGKPNGIKVFKSLDHAIQSIDEPIDYLIIGVATAGGILPDNMKSIVKSAIESKISIVNGLHNYLNDNQEFSTLAHENGVELIDIRKPRPKEEQKFWSGKIYSVTSPIIAVLGTDCAVGKRTTARFLEEKLKDEGVQAEMIYTGQTGYLQDGAFGFIFDSTINDFVSGELEDAIVQCFEKANPDVILLEGQSALMNPSGPCGSEYLVSANAKATILQAVPGRKYYKGWDQFGVEIASLEKHIQLINLYGSEVIAITFNTEGLSKEEAFEQRKVTEERLKIPVILPIEEGVDRLSTIVKNYIQ